MKTRKILAMSILLCTLLLAACMQVDITTPRGQQGKDGLSSYEFWKTQVAAGTVTWDKSATTVTDYFKFLQGKSGKEGKSAYEEWKAYIASGQVDDPHHLGQKWNPDDNSLKHFWLYLTGATGEAGQVPHIGENGNWFIGTKDTGIPARGTKGDKGDKGDDGKKGDKGDDGKDGTSPNVRIGENGNWFINDVDTQHPAFGTNGTNGQSAYEIWKEYISSGEVPHPHEAGQFWPASQNTLEDFWYYLSGKQGQKGADGKPGRPGEPGKVVLIIKGKPNVIAQYHYQAKGEYVNPVTGGVLYKVYNKEGEIAKNAKVKNIPGLDPKKEFTSNNKGEFTIPREYLPSIQEVERRWGTCLVTLEGENEPSISAKNTYVPNRVQVKLERGNTDASSWGVRIDFNVYVKYNPEDSWTGIPYYFEDSFNSLYLMGYEAADMDDPTIVSDKALNGSYDNLDTYSSYSEIESYVYGYIAPNKLGWTGQGKGGMPFDTKTYFTLKHEGPTVYGETFSPNVTSILPIYQAGPRLKTLKLKGYTKTSSNEVFFAEIEGEFDFSDIDYTKMVNGYNVKPTPSGGEYIEPTYYTEAEAKGRDYVWLKFTYTTSIGKQVASSENNESSFAKPTFKVLSPYLNAEIESSAGLVTAYQIGHLRKDETAGEHEHKYKVVYPEGNKYKIPPVEVTYEELPSTADNGTAGGGGNNTTAPSSK